MTSTDCTDDFGDGFTVRCDQADVFRDRNGLCYNYSGVHERTPIGWWDVQKRLEYKKPVLPSQDYYEYEPFLLLYQNPVVSRTLQNNK